MIQLINAYLEFASHKIINTFFFQSRLIINTYLRQKMNHFLSKICCCWRSSTNQQKNKQEGQQSPMNLSKSKSQGNSSQKKYQNKRKIQGIEETSNTYTKNIVYLQIDQQWSSSLKFQRSLLKNVRILIENANTNGSIHAILNIIKSSYKKIVVLIKNRSYKVNINILSMLKTQISQPDFFSNYISSVKDPINIEQLFSQRSQQDGNQHVVRFLENIQQKISQQYAFFVDDQSQKQLLLQQLNHSLENIKQPYLLKRNTQQSQALKKIASLFIDLLVKQMINQYLYAIKFIISQYQSIFQKAELQKMQKQWIQLSREVRSSCQLDKINWKIQQFCIVNAMSLKQPSSSDIPRSSDQSQSYNSSSRQQIDSNKDNIQSNLKKKEQRKKKQNKEDKSIKLYTISQSTTNFYVNTIIYLQYVLISQFQNYNKYKFESLLIENLMNNVRYINDINQDFIFKLQVTQDTHPENSPLHQNDIVEKQKVFQFRSEKGDKDYSTLYKGFKKQNILRSTLWGYRDKKIIYSYLKSLAKIIMALEKHHIHHTDLQFRNCIKFGNTFQVIDFKAAFFVKGNKKSEKYFNFNKQIFECWLGLGYQNGEKFCCLTSSWQKYGRIKQRNFNSRFNGDKVPQCMDQMQPHMKFNHKRQFHQQCLQLLSYRFPSNSPPLFSQQQIAAIISIVPRLDDQKNDYNHFIHNLETIYKTFYQSSQQLSNHSRFADSICKKLSFASEDLKDINEQESNTFTNKIKATIEMMHQKPFKNIVYYHQTCKMKNGDILLLRLDNTHKLSQNIFSQARYIINFIKCVISLQKQLQFRGCVLLSTDIDLFTQHGQRFILSNLAYILKVIPKGEDTQKEQQLLQLSCNAFIKLYLYNNKNNLRTRLFAKQLQLIIQRELFHSCQNPENDSTFSKGKIVNLFQKHIKTIHFIMFKRMISLALSQADEALASCIGQLIKGKNQQNYFQLQQSLLEPIGQSY